MIVWLTLGILAFLMFYLSGLLSPEHTLLKILTIIFGLLFIIILSKAAFENQDYCEVVVHNQTTTYNTTDFNYEYFCSDNPKTTFTTSFKLTLSYFFVFLLYVFIYFNKEIFEWIEKKIGRAL